MLKQIKRFIEAEDGATAVEYGILVAVIAAVIIISAKALGVKISGEFTNVTAQMP